MSQLGERFREAREARGLSITEASTATRILPRYIQAIEAGDVASLPGDVYARGFIRNYAQFLGLPGDEMIDLYRQARGEPTGRIKVVPAARPPRTRSCLIPSFFVTFFTMLVLLAAFYFVLSSTGMLTQPKPVAGVSDAPTSIPPTTTTWPTPTYPPPGATVSALPPAPTEASPTPNPNATAGPSAVAAATVAAATATSNAPVVVQAIVTNDTNSLGSWFTVDVDGASAYNALLRPGRQMQWSGQHEVFLNIGDTSVVQLTVNGQAVPGLPGTVRGVPRKLTCTPQGCG